MKEIKLTQGKFALVDDEDFDELNKFNWFYCRGYGFRNSSRLNGPTRLIPMHRVIMNTPKGMFTDHRDHNGLNNQKNNLRICNHAQNMANRRKQVNGITSKFKGVVVLNSRSGLNKSYRTYIEINGKKITKSFPFTHDGEIAAAKHYNELAKKHFGEFAHLNEI